MSCQTLKGVKLIPFKSQIANESKWIVLKMKNCVKKNFKNSLFENSYSWKFFIIDPKFVSQNNFHHYEKFKRRKKSPKNTITNIILYIHTFSNNISNHHFHKIYTGHQFLHLSSNCMHLYVNLDVVNCDDDKERWLTCSYHMVYISCIVHIRFKTSEQTSEWFALLSKYDVSL